MNDRDHVDAVRRDRNAFDHALQALGLTTKGKSATCPWHEDKNPSASILENPDGSWKLYCHVCARSGDVFDLREQSGGPAAAEQLHAIHQKAKDENAKQEEKRAPARVYQDLDAAAASLSGIGRIESTFEYANPDSHSVELAVFRIMPADGKKTFRQASPCNGGWRLEAPPKPWPIYNRTRVRAASQVVVVEGEKVVHALHAVGIVATTSPCGAGKAEHADWSPLSGKQVVLWPDHDDPGHRHMADVRRALEALPHPPRLSLIDPQGLGLAAKGDAADLVAALAGSPEDRRRAVQSAIDDAQQLGASRELGMLLEDAISGKRKAIAWPWPRLTELSRALLPETLTVLCGDPGCGKSFLLLESAATWHRNGEHVAMLALEDDRRYHLRRALAQIAGNAGLFDDKWCSGHPAVVRQAMQDHGAFIDEFGRRIFDAPKQMRLTEIADWIEARAKAGARLVIVDPSTAGIRTAKGFIEDQDLVMRAKASAKDYGASVILSTHPVKGVRGRAVDIHDIAGGASYSRFAHSILWLEKHEKPKRVIISNHDVEVTRTLVVMKARNGPGHGARIGMHLEGSSLRFAEVGLITGKSGVHDGPHVSTDHGDSNRAHHAHDPAPWEDHFDPQARASGDTP